MNKHQLIALSLMTSLCCVTPLTSAAQSAAAYARPLVSDTLQQLTMPTEKRIQLKRKPQIVKKKTVQFAQGLERRTVIVKFHDGTRIRASNPNDLNIGSSETRILLERINYSTASDRV